MNLQRILPPLRAKFKALYLPFLTLQFGLLFILSFLGWLLILKFDVLPIHHTLSTFFIPSLAGWLFYRLYLHPKLTLVHLWDDGKRDRGRMLYEMLFVAFLTWPSICSLSYLSKASFGLNQISSANQVANYPYEKYFLPDSFDLNTVSYFVYTENYVTGKNKSNLVFARYYVCPFEKTKNVWLGVKYQLASSNNRDNTKKQADLSEFKLECDAAFRELDMSKVQYFVKIPDHSDDMDGFLAAIFDKFPELDTQEQIILQPDFGDFNRRSDKAFFWLWVALLVSCMGALLMCLAPKLKHGALRQAPGPLPAIRDYLREFQIQPGMQATAAMICLMALYYFGTILTDANTGRLMSGNAYTTGALQLFNLQQGEYWRLLTYTFVPKNPFLFSLNIVGMFLTGAALERKIGPLKLVVSYVFCGIIAVLIGSNWYSNTTIVPSSGAVYGLWGMVLAFSIRKVFPKDERNYQWQVWAIFAGVPLIIGWVLMDTTTCIACVAGLIGGLFPGWMMNPKNKN